MESARRTGLRAALVACVGCVMAVAPLAAAEYADAVEYFNVGLGHYFMTAQSDEIAALDSGAYNFAFVRTGASFKVWNEPVVGAVPVCRFFTTPGVFGTKGSHFYTANPLECEGLKSNPNWIYEKVAFYIALPTAGDCPDGMMRVYRMFNNGQTGAPNHRFTTGLAVYRDFTTTKNWAAEGAAFCSPDQADTHTYQQGSLLFMEWTDGSDIRRVALNVGWGGAMVEYSINGKNLINAHDTGRLIGLSIYDGSQTYTDYNCPPFKNCAWGWNPVQGGDRFNHGSQIVDKSLTGSSIYVKSRPLEWFPDDKGGGINQAISSDVIYEQTISRVAGHPQAVMVRNKITHLGVDSHGFEAQELPYVYANAETGTLEYYGGLAPYTNEPTNAVSILPPCPTPSSPYRYSPERWAAFSNGSDLGLTLFMPLGYPYVEAVCTAIGDGTSGPLGDSTNYMRFMAPASFGPSSIFESTYYLFTGSIVEARQAIYDITKSTTFSDSYPPFVTLDIPTIGSVITGKVDVAGWAIDNAGVSGVDVLVDDVLTGTATIGLPRPDIPGAYPNASGNAGFEYSWNTRTVSNGTHVISVRARDQSGNVSTRNATVTVSN